MTTVADRRRQRYAARVNRSTEEDDETETGFEAVFEEEPSSTQDDEALARALQEEYNHAEFSRVSSQRSFASSSNPDITVNRNQSNLQQQEQQHEEYARRLQEESFGIVASNSSSSTASRELPSARNPSYRKPTSTPATSRSNSMVSSPSNNWADFGDSTNLNSNNDDEALARRMTQELQDEDFARNVQKLEEERISRSRAILMQPRSQQQQQHSCLRRFCCYMIPLSVIAVSLAAILYYIAYGSDSLPDWMPSPEEFANEDPFLQQLPNETSRWRNSGHGLELHVLNALDDEWYPYFYTAISEWENGSPDTLTLTSTQINADSTCKTVARTLKVCNGNYGETAWRGINKLLLEDNSIYASAARMNEFYFGSNDEDQRQYTMCHEIGHGFGLPHTDESFTNKDLGNCMDYTSRPQNNRQPAAMNFEFLQELYGVVPGSETTVTAAESVPENQDQEETSENNPVEFDKNQAEDETDEKEEDQEEDKKKEKDKKKKDKKDDRRRRLKGRETTAVSPRHLSETLYRPEDHPTLSRRVLRTLHNVEQEIEDGLWVAENGWKLLHRTEYGEAHEKHVGEGYRVQVHLLLA